MAILVVDDSEDIRAFFEAVLTEGGYHDIMTADFAAAAFALLALDAQRKTVPLDVVFLDVVMPDMDGIAACARIRRDPRYFDVPIVMITALDAIESVDKAFEHGATDYLTKPLKVVDLLACVRSNMLLKAGIDRRNAVQRELMQHQSSRFDNRPAAPASSPMG